MKYSLDGRSCLQEVDNMQKQIEDAMQVSKFYSPISFLRMLLKVNRKKPYQVIQMNENDFKDFRSSSKMMQCCSFAVLQGCKVTQKFFKLGSVKRIYTQLNINCLIPTECL